MLRKLHRIQRGAHILPECKGHSTSRRKTDLLSFILIRCSAYFLFFYQSFPISRWISWCPSTPLYPPFRAQFVLSKWTLKNIHLLEWTLQKLSRHTVTKRNCCWTEHSKINKQTNAGRIPTEAVNAGPSKNKTATRADWWRYSTMEWTTPVAVKPGLFQKELLLQWGGPTTSNNWCWSYSSC